MDFLEFWSALQRLPLAIAVAVCVLSGVDGGGVRAGAASAYFPHRACGNRPLVRSRSPA